MSRRSLVIVAVVSGLLIGGFVVLRARWTDDLLAQWQAELAQAGPNEAAQLLDRALYGGEMGLMLAVASLGAPQPHVAEAAHEAISERLERIAREPESSTLWPQQLAAELARQTPNFDRPGRRRAANLALKMLTSLHRTAGEDRTRLTAHCRRVVELYDEPVDETKPAANASSPLSSGGTSSPGAPSSGISAPPLVPADATKHDDAARRLPTAAELLSPDHLRAVASGEADRLHPCPAAAQAGGRSASASGSPAPHPADSGGRKPATGGPRDGIAEADRRDQGAPDSQRDPSAAALRPMSLGAADTAEDRPLLSAGGDGSPATNGRAEATMEVRDLIGLLSGREPQAARSELQRRGFGPVELALAEKMADPDPQVRKQLARLLPQMTSIEPQRWLLWMCRDEDAEVRLTAISLLATCGNPAVLAEVEQRAAADTDPRVRRLGEQVSARRAAASSGPALR